jgi:putative mRNA 3-end processing factor
MREFGFISHAHSDHSAKHKKIICTEPTADFLQIRQKKANCIKLPYDQKYPIGDMNISLHPAGHILGSAQILIESGKRRLLYTGDFRTKPSRTAENYRPVKCDTLIMETTFGKAHYKFPPREDVEKDLLQLVTDKLKAGLIPVVFAYPLGKAQEILHLISHSGIKVAADYSILRLAHIYKKYDVRFGEFEKFRRSEFRDRVLLMPVSFRHQRFIKNIPDKYTIFMSGWGMDASAKFRLQVDRVMPYSDHADFDELVQTAVKSGADEIYCTHGFDDFVTVLRNMGLNAHPLIPKPQMDLFD